MQGRITPVVQMRLLLMLIIVSTIPMEQIVGTGTPAQTARESFCRGDPETPATRFARVRLRIFCATSPTANPFDADLCMTYGSTRDSIIRSCITAR